MSPDEILPTHQFWDPKEVSSLEKKKEARNVSSVPKSGEKKRFKTNYLRFEVQE
jgi:hypothetical protein